MKLEEITNQIYAQGVEKGKNEAQEIVAKAQQEAAAIVEKAQADAEALLARAKEQAAELDKNTRAELKMFASQSVNALKTEITDLINGQIVASNVKAATADAKFMQSIIAAMAQQMAKDGSVAIAAKDAEALKQYFAANAKDLLDKGVTISEVKGTKAMFEIKPEKGGYKLAFGDAELEAYFKEFLRPQLIDLLF